MGSSITLAGESLIAQKQAAQQTLSVKRFIFANVPGLNTAGPVDRAAGKPAAAQVVYSADIPSSNAGYVNPNQVVYSLQVGSDVGDWDFNWIGLETAEGVLFAVAYVPLQQKRRNIPPQQVGNNITRNFLVVFDGAQALTAVTIDAKTWQHDFTVRLAGIDERERQSNRDVYGRACFFGSALQVEKVGSAYQVKPGTAYVEGIRLQRDTALAIVPPALPTTAWLDVALQRELSDVVASWSVVFGSGLVDRTDSAGTRHYLVPIADLASAASLIDRRPVEAINAPLVQHFASKSFVLGELAKQDAKQSVRVATTANLASLAGLLIVDGEQLIEGDPVLVKDQADGKANGIYIAAASAWARSADADASIEVTPGMLVPVEQGTVNGDSLWQLVTDAPITLGTTALAFEVASGPTGLAAGSYRSVTVDKRGRVIGGSNPTTLQGFGIVDGQPLAQLLTDLVANNGWGTGRTVITNEPNLNNHKTGGKFVTPAQGLVGLPAGWAQGRHTLDVVGGDSYCSQRLAGAGVNKGRLAERTWDGTSWSGWLELFHTGNLDTTDFLPRDYLSGLAIANSASVPATDIVVSPGCARSAEDDASLRLAAALTKRLQTSGSWAAGSGGNGLFAGARAASTWYHVFLIRRDIDGALDAGFDTSISAANRPAGYSAYRRIGSVKTDASGVLLAFNTELFPGGRRRFRWDSPPMDISNAAVTTAAVNYVLSVPPGLPVLVDMTAYYWANNIVMSFGPPDGADVVPTYNTSFTTYTGGIGAVTDASTDSTATQVFVRTNAASQIRARANRGGNLWIMTLGWEE
ncbi:phage tail protein [Pseudomonas mosselii]|uniref:phage tail protein n=1 Tax=Pseudomonas mosselii TaxID=78327 RepID=UPI00202308CD|nr:phage tail protein [Pseudomonas mosselii]MCL8302189.1 phage tail protein [Pseudomonas mosselii]